MTIREIREKQGLTQEELAARVGVERSSISKYESGDRAPSLLVLRRLAETLHCTVDELLHAFSDASAR